MATHTNDMVELRIDITRDLANKIDALMMVDKLKSRADYVVPVLTESTNAAIHRAIVLLRCANINPLLSTAGGNLAD